MVPVHGGGAAVEIAGHEEGGRVVGLAAVLDNADEKQDVEDGAEVHVDDEHEEVVVDEAAENEGVDVS